MTGVQLLAFTRMLIQESSAGFWTDANIQYALNCALKKFSACIQQSSNSFYLESAALTLSAAAQYASLPTGCAGVVYCVLDNNNNYKPLGKIPFNRIPFTLVGDPLSICVANGKIYFDRCPSSAKSYTAYYMRTPATISVTGTTEIDFPSLHHELLAYEAAIISYIKDRADPSILMAERKEMVGALLNSLGDNIMGIPNKTFPSKMGNYNGE